MTLALEYASVGSDSAQILPSGEGMLESLYTTVIFGLQRVRRTRGVARVYWLYWLCPLAIHSSQGSFV